MKNIPKYSANTTIFTLFNNKLQVWTNYSYSFEFNRDIYQNYNRYILRLGKILICYTRI